jgi:hypothetical protein
MKLELDLVLNRTSPKFFVKLTKTKDFKNPANWSQDQTKVLYKMFLKLNLGARVPFEIKN